MGIMHKNTATSALTPPSTSAETVIYTTPSFLVPNAVTNPVNIAGTVNITPGTGTTAVIIRVRQGSLAGPIISGSPSHAVAAGAAQSISFGATDATTFLEAPGVYVITAQQMGASANGVTNAVDVEVST